MTIERESRRSDVYLGDGRNTSLPFGFKVFLPTEIAVVLNENGVERTLSHGHGCTVSLNAEQDVQPGGTVRLDTPLPPGSKAVVLSNVRPLQQVDLTNQGGFYPDVLNAVHDRLTMLVQQLMELQARTPQVPATDDATAEDLSRQILELSRSIPGMRRLLQSGDVARLLDILRRNPLLRETELSSAVDSTREDVAATSKAVKAAYDKAKAAEDLADGKADASHTHTHAQISDWDSALAQSVSQAVANAFPVQKADNGYLKLPNGLILQWGKVASGWPGEGPYTVTFPIAFPNKCLNTQITMWSDGRKGSVNLDITIPVGMIRPVSFDALFNGIGFPGSTAADLKGFYWFAIGY
nr:MAG TPA: tailspike protein [Caudoviricetes sp.]